MPNGRVLAFSTNGRWRGLLRHFTSAEHPLCNAEQQRRAQLVKTLEGFGRAFITRAGAQQQPLDFLIVEHSC